jgi:hypothetical protein
MGAVGKKALQARFGFRHGVGSCNAGHVEAARARVLEECCLDLVGFG